MSTSRTRVIGTRLGAEEKEPLALETVGGMPVSSMSPRQRARHERDLLILAAAKQILLERGYYGLTMDRVAERCECPKGTMYQRFASKEDIIIALALQCLRHRLDMVHRASAFSGRPRERMTAIGEAVGLYSRLYPDDSRVLHAATGPIREKASAFRVAELIRSEAETVAVLRGILEDAVTCGDLCLAGEIRIEALVFAFWSLVEGSYTMIESGVPENALGIQNPFYEIWNVYIRLADSYGWKPLHTLPEWKDRLAEVRRSVFPEEAQRLYGAGNWHGDER